MPVSSNKLWKEFNTDTPWKDEGGDPFKPPALTSTVNSSSKSSSKSGGWARCYDTHPPYPVAEGIVIYGGSCINPKVKDAVVYGGFDGGMSFQKPGYPWNPPQAGPVEFLFRIHDRDVPENLDEFKKMIAWLAEQLLAGKKVHLGCIGGHGRTGLVLSALRKHMTGDEDAITHVRTYYCKKAVETAKQVNWLHQHFGIKKVEATKADYVSSGKGKQQSFGFGGGKPLKYHSYGNDELTPPLSTGKPLVTANSIWGKDD